jgi:hypothetical protein
LYFLLVFGCANTASSAPRTQRRNDFSASQAETQLPKLLSFEGVSSNKKVKLNWKFETTDGLEACVLERADQSSDFKPVAYFFMTEDIHVPDLRFTDSVAENKTYQYRLILTGKNGDKQLTKTLSFNFGKKQDQKISLSDPLVKE